MKVNVTFGERFVSHDLPEGVWAGLTVYDNDCHWIEMNLLEKSNEQIDEEIINEDGLRVVVRCYTCSEFAEVAEIFNEFKGLSLYECRCEKMSISVEL